MASQPNQSGNDKDLRDQQIDAFLKDIPPEDMLKLLNNEEALLVQMHRKISDELQRLQVEEHVFLNTLKILSSKQATTGSEVSKDEIEGEVNEDEKLLEAIQEALME